MKTFDARTVERWRAWLAQHHASGTEIWLIFHKQHTGKPSIDYLDALDEVEKTETRIEVSVRRC
jgi:uncharacterized protein YdeI (YjbR/CyaY-like superfamily)